MKYFGEGFSEKHRMLSSIIRRPAEFERAMALFSELHMSLHISEGSEADLLFRDLTRREWTSMPGAKDETIAWSVWHIARLEDLAMGVLAASGAQVFDEAWRARLGSPITDTGNALDDDGIMDLSAKIDIPALIEYRNAVGRRTEEIVASFSADDMRRRPEKRDLDRLLSEGGLIPETRWLADYWADKDIAGLLLMPPTREAVMHLNSCARFKSALRGGKKPYMCV